MLDDEEIRFIDKFQEEVISDIRHTESKFPHLIKIDFLLEFIYLMLEHIHENPKKWSEKQFNIINRMIKKLEDNN